jgi:hypothetical protein
MKNLWIIMLSLILTLTGCDENAVVDPEEIENAINDATDDTTNSDPNGNDTSTTNDPDSTTKQPLKNDQVLASSDTPVNGQINDSNLNLTFSITDEPEKGNVAINAEGDYIYTATEGKIGVDSFTIKSVDDENNEDFATVNVILVPDPVAMEQANVSDFTHNFTSLLLDFFGSNEEVTVEATSTETTTQALNFIEQQYLLNQLRNSPQTAQFLRTVQSVAKLSASTQPITLLSTLSDNFVDDNKFKPRSSSHGDAWCESGEGGVKNGETDILPDTEYEPTQGDKVVATFTDCVMGEGEVTLNGSMTIDFTTLVEDAEGEPEQLKIDIVVTDFTLAIDDGEGNSGGASIDLSASFELQPEGNIDLTLNDIDITATGPEGEALTVSGSLVADITLNEGEESGDFDIQLTEIDIDLSVPSEEIVAQMSGSLTADVSASNNSIDADIELDEFDIFFTAGEEIKLDVLANGNFDLSLNGENESASLVTIADLDIEFLLPENQKIIVDGDFDINFSVADGIIALETTINSGLDITLNSSSSYYISSACAYQIDENGNIIDNNSCEEFYQETEYNNTFHIEGLFDLVIDLDANNNTEVGTVEMTAYADGLTLEITNEEILNDATVSSEETTITGEGIELTLNISGEPSKISVDAGLDIGFLAIHNAETYMGTDESENGILLGGDINVAFSLDETQEMGSLRLSGDGFSAECIVGECNGETVGITEYDLSISAASEIITVSTDATFFATGTEGNFTLVTTENNPLVFDANNETIQGELTLKSDKEAVLTFESDKVTSTFEGNTETINFSDL